MDSAFANNPRRESFEVIDLICDLFVQGSIQLILDYLDFVQENEMLKASDLLRSWNLVLQGLDEATLDEDYKIIASSARALHDTAAELIERGSFKKAISLLRRNLDLKTELQVYKKRKGL